MMNKSGIIFPVVMWLLITVTALVIVQRQFVHHDSLLAAYGNQRSEAVANAFSGVAWSQHVIEGLSRDEDVFYIKNINPPAEWTDKFYLMPTIQNVNVGIGSESGKVNLNAINALNVKFLENLFIYHGMKEDKAQELGLMVVNWHLSEAGDVRSEVAEKIKFKKRAFESIDELRLLPGMTNGIFFRLKEDVTVYPKDQAAGELRINILTASVAVRTALAKFIKDNDPNFDDREVLSLWQRAQLGNDGKPYTEDDGTGGFSVEEKGKITTPYVQLQSQVYHVIVKGVSSNRKVNVYLEAFLKRDDGVVSEGGSGRIQLLELRQIRP